MGDPAIQNMNSTQWTFELVGLVERDKRHYEDMEAYFKSARSNLIDLLGLNLMPVEDVIEDSETGETFTRVRRPNEDEIMPLALMSGNETILSELSKMHKELKSQEDIDQRIENGEVVEMTPEELDEFMDDGDIVFPDNPADLEKQLKWNSEENKQILNSLVKPLNDKDKDLETPNVIEGYRKKPSSFKIK